MYVCGYVYEYMSVSVCVFKNVCRYVRVYVCMRMCVGEFEYCVTIRSSSNHFNGTSNASVSS